MEGAPERRPWSRAAGGGAWVSAAVLGCCLAAAAFLRIPAFGMPVDRDVAVYAVIGRALADGSLPYRDLIDHKQPVVYPVYAALDALAPASATMIHVASAVVAGLASWLLFRTLRRFIGDRPAGAAAGAAILVGASRYVEGFGLNTEHLLLVTGTIPIALALTHPPRGALGRAALIGVACAVAVLTKAVAVLLLPAVALALVLRLDARDRTRDLAAVAIAGAGVLAVVAAVYAAAGAIDDFLAWNVTYNADYAGQLTLGERFERVRMYPADLLLIAVATAAAGAVLLRRGTRDALAVTLAAWLVGATAGALLGGFGYAHYYAPIVLPAAALMILAVTSAPPHRWRLAALVAAGVAIAPFAFDNARALAGGSDALTQRAYGDQARVWQAYEPVGRLIRNRARPGDRLYVAGNEAGFYWQAQVQPASRLLYDLPVSLRPELGEELQRAICTRPPRFVVLTTNVESPHLACLRGAGYAVVARRPPAVAVLDRGR